MKRVLTLFVCFLLVFNTYSNENVDSLKTKYHEMGINLFSYHSYQYFIYAPLIFLAEPDVAYVNGITYKYHFKKNAFRSALLFNHNSKPLNKPETAPGGWTNFYTGKIPYYGGMSRAIMARLGYQRSFFNFKLSPFISSELIFTYGKYKGKMTDRYDNETLINSPFYTYGFDLSIGLNYKFLDNFSVSYEFGPEMRYSVYTSGTVNLPTIDYTFGKPIKTVSFNYHF